MIFPYFLGSISSLNSQPRKLAATCYAMNTAPDFPLIGKVRSYEWHFANTLCILQLSAFTALPVQLCSTACFSVCKQRGQFLRGLTRQVEPFYSAFGLSWSANSKILFKKNFSKILKCRFNLNKTPILVYCCLFEVMWLYQLTVPKVNLPPKKKVIQTWGGPGLITKTNCCAHRFTHKEQNGDDLEPAEVWRKSYTRFQRSRAVSAPAARAKIWSFGHVWSS